MGNRHEYTSGLYGKRKAFAEAVAALMPDDPPPAFCTDFVGRFSSDYAPRRADLLQAIRSGYWEPLEPMPLDIKYGYMGITPEEYTALYLLIYGSAHTTSPTNRTLSTPSPRLTRRPF